MFTAFGGEGRALSRRVKYICKRRGGVRHSQRVKRKQPMQADFISFYILKHSQSLHYVRHHSRLPFAKIAGKYMLPCLRDEVEIEREVMNRQHFQP